MAAKRINNSDYQTLSSSGTDDGANDYPEVGPPSPQKKTTSADGLSNLRNKNEGENLAKKLISGKQESALPEKQPLKEILDPKENLPYPELQKFKKKEKEQARDFNTLSKEFWLARNGHTLTFIGVYFFSILVFFRPYEITPVLSFLSATAFFVAAATLLVYLPTQLLTEGNFTVFSTEVKAILALSVIAGLTIPIAKSPATAVETFNDPFIKAVVMFIVMVNVVRTQRRLMMLLWLSLGVGVYLSFTSLRMFYNGEFNSEGYRIGAEIGGLFGNPNDMALHLVMMTPLALVLGFCARNRSSKIIYFIMTGLLVAANTVTYSRGGFLGLLAVAGIVLWKLGRKNRLKIFSIGLVAAALFVVLAPGDYGQRILSIFSPGLDAVGSSDQRKQLLVRSILVSIRNPWGIGIGNFPIVGIQNLQTHNAYTQISSELGIAGLAAYLLFILSPLRKFLAMERILRENTDLRWFYYLSIGFQASIVGYMVSSFFVSVAYNWYIYYLIAYAVAFRRIYQISLMATDTGLEKKITS